MAPPSRDSQLLSVILSYLQSQGFSKSVKKLRKEIKSKGVDIDDGLGSELMDKLLGLASTPECVDGLVAVDTPDTPDTPDSSVANDEDTKRSKKKKRKMASTDSTDIHSESNSITASNIDTTGVVGVSNSPAPRRFQRVNPEEVEFAKEELKDNTFMGKTGAFNSYGHKAHNDLSVTKGKGFLKAKNKKKRGSYKGGKIDMGSHSIKFNE